jgi:hypothetical protein
VAALFADGASAGTIATPGVAVPTSVVRVVSPPEPEPGESEGEEDEPAGGVY